MKINKKQAIRELEQRIEIYKKLIKIAHGDENDEFYEIVREIISHLEYLIDDSKEHIRLLRLGEW